MGVSVFERVEITAGGKTLSFGIDGRDAVRVTAWNWPLPAQKLVSAQGPEGSSRVDGNEWEDREITVELDTAGGNVAGVDGIFDPGAERARQRVVNAVRNVRLVDASDWALDVQSVDGEATIDLDISFVVGWAIAHASGSATVSVLDDTEAVLLTVTQPFADTSPRLVSVTTGPIPTGLDWLTLRIVADGRPVVRPLATVAGANGAYFDLHTPGTQDGRTRFAAGEPWARSVRAALSDMAGRVSRDMNATVRRVADDGESVTFRLHSLDVAVEEDGRGYLGWHEPKLKMVAAPIGEGEWESFGGSVTMSGREARWVGGGLVRGTLPARVSVSTSWPTGRDSMLAATTTADSTVYTNGGGGGWTLYPGVAWNGLPSLDFPSPTPSGQPFPLIWRTSSVAGRFMVLLMGPGPTWATPEAVSFLVNGRVVGRVTAWARGVASQPIVFGAHDLKVGDRIELAVEHSGSSASRLGMQRLVLVPAREVSAVENRLSTGTLVAGDTPNLSAAGIGAPLTGVAGRWGGTFTAPNWTRANHGYPAGYAYETDSTTAERSISLGTVQRPFRAEWRGVFADGPSTMTFKAGPMPSHAAGGTWNPGALTDVTLTVDADGKWEVEAQDEWGEVYAAVGTTASWVAPAAVSLSVQRGSASKTFIYGDIKLTQLPSAPTGVEWSDSSSALVRGDYPTFTPGVTPRLSLHPGPTNIVSPETPTVTVDVTPRYLALPGGV